MTNDIIRELNKELSEAAHNALGLVYEEPDEIADILGPDDPDSIRRELERTNPITIVAYGGDTSLDELWEYSPITKHIRAVARGQMVSPMTLLMSILSYTAQFIPPHVVLDHVVGGYASLNTFGALVGASGGGKGASNSVIEQCVNFGDEVDAQNLGSGEGVGALFGAIVKGEEVWRRNAVLLQAQEIGTMEKTLERNGATLKEELNKAWSGERLGFSNRDAARSIQPGDHRYRINVLVGAQPDVSAVLLDADSVGRGFAQRWFFANVDDLGGRRTYTTPDKVIDWPGIELSDRMSRDDKFDGMGKPENDFYVIKVPNDIGEAVRIAREYRVRRGVFDALDSHVVLMRMKVAAQVALLHGRANLTDDDWDLAGALMRHHRSTRSMVQDALSEARDREGKARAASMGRYAAISDAAKEQADFEQVLAHAYRVVDDMSAAGMSGKEWKRHFQSAIRKTHREAVEDELIRRGRLIRKEISYRGQEGLRYSRGHVE